MPRSFNPNYKFNMDFSIYLVSFTGFFLYLVHWIEKILKSEESRPHPLIVDGKKVEDTVSCTPDSKECDTIDPTIRTMTDIRKYDYFFPCLVIVYYRSMERRTLCTMENNGYHSML